MPFTLQLGGARNRRNVSAGILRCEAQNFPPTPRLQLLQVQGYEKESRDRNSWTISNTCRGKAETCVCHKLCRYDRSGEDQEEKDGTTRSRIHPDFDLFMVTFLSVCHHARCDCIQRAQGYPHRCKHSRGFDPGSSAHGPRFELLTRPTP